MARRRKRRFSLSTAAFMEFLSLLTLVAVVQPAWAINFLNDALIAISGCAELAELPRPASASTSEAVVESPAMPRLGETVSTRRNSDRGAFPMHTARVSDANPATNHDSAIYPAETSLRPAFASY